MSLENRIEPEEGAFVTIFYDYGEDSEAMMLAIRVLMRSIRNSKTIYRKIVIIPQDGMLVHNREQFRMDDPEIEIFRSEIPNVFLHTSLSNPHAQIRHARNKLILWDNSILSKLKRFVYLDPENLVLGNMDEIFACSPFCAVDNGQSIVYSNSLFVINPSNIAARNLYSDAIDAFMISGREYNYVGISQGFLPGLFQALEESPLFSLSQNESIHDSVVRRLPFYYSINHMVFYERLNWDLYRCNDKEKGLSTIPGPLLSFKYSGNTIKPWFWLAYGYFQVNWYWQEVRETLEEDHFQLFLSKLMIQTGFYLSAWYGCVVLCLKLRSEPSGRMRRLSSSNWGLPAPGNAPPRSIDILNSRVVRKFCQLTCNLLIAIASMPLVSSILTVGIIMWTSIYSIPPTMHPRYACILWAFLLNSLMMTTLIVYKITHTFRTAEWSRDKIPSSMALLIGVLRSSGRQMPQSIMVEIILLYVIGRIDWFQNPVLRPIIILSLLFVLIVVQIRLVAREMTRVSTS